MIKKLLTTLAVLAALAPLTHAQQTLSSLAGRSRVLLVIAPDSLDRRFSLQLDNFAHHSTDFGARDLVLVPVVPDSDLPSASPVLRSTRMRRAAICIDPCALPSVTCGSACGASFCVTEPADQGCGTCIMASCAAAAMDCASN